MALIEHLTSGVRHALTASHLVGRSPACELRLDAAYVSGEHASFRWRKGAWEVRDLGSRNGTFVDGHRLDAGARAPVSVGQTVAFGHADDAWQVLDVGAPGLMAVCVQTRVVVSAEADMLALPGAADPAVTVCRTALGRWRVERDDGVEEVDSLVTLRVGDRDWRLYAPVGVGDTASAQHRTLTLKNLRLLFRVSLDEEHIELIVSAGTRSFDLGARAFHGVLLALARARREDEKNSALPETAHGWVYKDDLLKEVGIAESLLNLHALQARREFEKLGVVDFYDIVDRRRAGKLRLGVARPDEEKI